MRGPWPAAAVWGGDAVSASSIIVAVGQILGTAASLLDLIGDVVNAKKVRDILDSADFPTFARRAAAAGDEALEAFKPHAD